MNSGLRLHERLALEVLDSQDALAGIGPCVCSSLVSSIFRSGVSSLRSRREVAFRASRLVCASQSQTALPRSSWTTLPVGPPPPERAADEGFAGRPAELAGAAGSGGGTFGRTPGFENFRSSIDLKIPCVFQGFRDGLTVPASLYRPRFQPMLPDVRTVQEITVGAPRDACCSARPAGQCPPRPHRDPRESAAFRVIARRACARRGLGPDLAPEGVAGL